MVHATLQHIAAYEGVPEIVQELVDAGADVRAQDPVKPVDQTTRAHHGTQQLFIVPCFCDSPLFSAR